MAGMAVDGHYVKFATISEKDIFFEVVDTDYESDSFSKSNTCQTRMIQNNGNHFLVVHGDCLRVLERNKRQSRKEDCLFQICCYGNSDLSTSNGVAVTLTVSYNGNTRLICSYEDGNGKGVYLQKGSLPDYIEESYHEAIFFLEMFKERTNFYRIKSSLWPEWFLTFEKKEAGVVKLVLREAGDDARDGVQLTEP